MNSAKKVLLLILASFLLTLFIYPSAFIYPRDILPDRNDTRLIAYIIGQVQRNLLEQQPLPAGRHGLHYGTFFAPDQSTLAYSDSFITSALITLPFRALTDHPILIFNLALVIGTVLTISTSFLIFEYLFTDIWLTVLATLLFNFSGFHLHYLPHLQMFILWPLLLSLYFFLRFQKENRSLFLILFFFSVTFQLAESIFPVYLIFFATIALLLSSPARTLLAGHLKTIILSALPFIPIWIFLLYPYAHLHFSLPEATRPIRDAAHFSLGLDQIFTQFHSWTVIITFVIASLLSKAWQSIKINTQFPGSPRRVLLAMTHWRGSKRHIFDSWKYILLFSIVMSLGPVLKLFGTNLRVLDFPIPLPYTLFYYLFPGFTGFRTPSRFIILALLSAVIIIAQNLKPLFQKLQTKTKFIFCLLVLSLLFLEADLPLKGYPVNINMHPVYEEVKALPPESVILELPIKLWNSPDHEIESIRSLYSLKHRHRRFGGFSGFATNSWIDLVQRIEQSGLTADNLARLRATGVTHVIKNNRLSPLP